MSREKDIKKFPCSFPSDATDDGAGMGRPGSSRHPGKDYFSHLDVFVGKISYPVIIANGTASPDSPVIMYVNRAVTKTMGYRPEQLLGKSITILLGPDSETAIIGGFKEALLRGVPFVYELPSCSTDRGTVLVKWNLIPIGDANKSPAHWILTQKIRENADGKSEKRISELVEQNKLLRNRIKKLQYEKKGLEESEEKYRMIIQNASEGIGVAQDGIFKFLNEKAIEAAGIPRENLTSMSFLNFIHSDDRAMVIDRHIRRMRGENPPTQYSIRLLGKDGKVHWLKLNVLLTTWEGRPATLNFITDITDHKNAEEKSEELAKKLRVLSANLLDAQEKERSRVSRELHDELGQALAFLKLRIASITAKLPRDQKSLIKECEETREYFNQTIENVRRLARDLSPSTLEDLGLSAAIRWLINNISQQYSINISLYADNVVHLLSHEDQLNIYRFCQEALNNVCKHSHASHAFVHLEKGHGPLTLKIMDNGRGFDINSVLGKDFSDRGMGLATMEERAYMMGASFLLRSGPGIGTFIRLQFPREKRNQDLE